MTPSAPLHLKLHPSYRTQPDMQPVKCENRSWWKRVFIHNSCYAVRNSPSYPYYFFGEDGRLCVTDIPFGFICDLTSMPWYLWSLTGLSPDGLIRASSLGHDWLYKNNGKVTIRVLIRNEWSAPRVVQFSQKFVDLEFKKRGKLDGVPPKKMNLAYRFVRTFGWIKRKW